VRLRQPSASVWRAAGFCGIVLCMEIAISVVIGLVVGLGSALMGSIWLVKVFRREIRLKAYQDLIDSTVGLTEGGAQPTASALSCAYYKAWLVAGKHAKAVLPKLKRLPSDGTARENAIEEFCEKAGPEVVKWWPA
jgi:hypothetical protein